MENLKPLATESFSYSWLLNGNPPLDGLADLESPRISIDEAGAFEITTFIVHQKRLLNEEAQNFNFDLPAASSESAILVHADEIFSEGQIIPLYINRSKNKAVKESLSDSITAAPESALTPTTIISQAQKDFIEKWRGLPSRMLHKWLRYLKPLLKRLGMQRNTAKVGCRASAPRLTKAYSAVDRTGEKQTGNKKKNLRKIRSWSNTPKASPSNSPYHSSDDKHDMECLVTEAILHCKRSFEASFQYITLSAGTFAPIQFVSTKYVRILDLRTKMNQIGEQSDRRSAFWNQFPKANLAENAFQVAFPP
nr:probable membrane-associated kinase regulator 6 isoform X1 [Ipomoea trifida]